MKALIIGVNGQDGSILRNLLVAQGIHVVGISRQKVYQWKDSFHSFQDLSHSLGDAKSSLHFLEQIRPDIIFHLAAVHGGRQSEINFRKDLLSEMIQCHLTIPQNIASWQRKFAPDAHLVVALTSQMFTPRSFPTIVSESTPTEPINQYADTKRQSWEWIQHFREEFNVSISCAILFNHTSIKSKKEFFFPLLAEQIRGILNGSAKSLRILDLDTPISISSAENICKALWKIAIQKHSEDYVLGNVYLASPRQILHKLSYSFPQIESSMASLASPSFPKPFLLPDISFAKSRLGVTFEEDPSGILSTFLTDFI